MPYAIRKKGDDFAVVNTETGKVKGTHDTKADAQKQINLLRGVEHGMVPRSQKKH